MPDGELLYERATIGCDGKMDEGDINHAHITTVDYISQLNYR